MIAVAALAPSLPGAVGGAIEAMVTNLGAVVLFAASTWVLWNRAEVDDLGGAP